MPHRDLSAVEKALAAPVSGQRWVVTESYFSMDGDSPDLVSLRALCDAAGAALIVDEAHAMGVFGPDGGGLCKARGIRADVIVAGLGKAVGAQGACVAGPAVLVHYLWNRARSFVFSTAPSPIGAAIAVDRVTLAREDHGGRARLRELELAFEEALGPVRQLLPEGRHGPIFPVVLGDPTRAVRVAAALRDRGFLVQPIRPPTVPGGASRVRIALHADLPLTTARALAAALVDLCAA